MAPPPFTNVLIVRYLVRVLTLGSITPLIRPVVDAYSTKLSSGDVKVKYSDFIAYRYLLAAIVIALAYALLQVVLTICTVSARGNHPGGDAMLQFDFYGDLAISYIIATSIAACFGMTQGQGMKTILDTKESSVEKFQNAVDATATIFLSTFLFTSASAVFSFLALPKRVQLSISR